MTSHPRRRLSSRGALKLASWTVFGTLGCLAVSIAYNWIAFRNLGEDALRQGLISATVLPIVLAGPLFLFLSWKLRELGIVNHQLNEIAAQDGLTGCLNRRAFTSQADRLLEEAPQTSRAVALLVADADHFKAINDGFGHDCGDEALRLIADAIRAALQPEAVIGRLGGEEFGVLIPGARNVEAAEVAERVRAAVASAQFAPGGATYPLSVSVGCAVRQRDEGFRELFRRADERLYAAKRLGRNRVVTVDAPPLAPSIGDLKAIR